MPIVIECPSINASPQGLLIRMPGGAELSVMTPIPTPSPLQVAKPLLGQINAALAPLTPVFNVIDTVIHLKKCLEAIPDSITSLSPGPILDCLPELGKKVGKLANLIPQLSTPLMILDIIDAIISTLDGIVTEIEAIVVQEAKIAAAMLASVEPGNEALGPIVECSQEVVRVQKQGLGEGLLPINRLIGVLNLFLDLIALPPLPDLANLPEDSQAAIDQLRGVVDLLKDTRASIPVP